MTSLQRVLRSFIEDGSISITSHADDGADFLYSIRGLGFHRDNMKTMQVLHNSRRSSSIMLLLFDYLMTASLCPGSATYVCKCKHRILVAV
jgi:hypothetical protein